MAAIEQCETQSSVLPTLSNTLNLFDTFKNSQEEDKDSDEESFHLPMLYCDDDLESNSNKEGVTMAEKDSVIPNGETEDDILNKFETIGTPDIDPKIEETILDDIDDACGKKDDDKIKDPSSDSNDANTSQEKDCVHDTEMITEKKPICNGLDSDDRESLAEPENSHITKEEEISTVDQNDKVDEEKIANDQGEGTAIVDNQTGETTLTTDDTKSAGTDENVTDTLESEISKEIKENIEECVANTTEVEVLHENSKDTEVSVTDKKEHNSEEPNKATDGTTEEKQNSEATFAESEKMDVDSIETENDNLLKDKDKIFNEPANTSVLTSDSKELKDDLEVMDVGDDADKKDGEKDTEKIESIKSTCDSQDETKDLVELKDVDMKAQSGDKVELQKQTSADDAPKSENGVSEKYENSNDSNKSQNLDCEDLLDISIIRDADEDNASAIAENANDNQSSEKSDNDDQDEGSEKAENDLDESEMEQDESVVTNDKDDHNMDFEDGNSSNLCEQDNLISGNTSDSENKDDVDIRDSEIESKDSSSSNSVLKNTPVLTNNTELNSDKIQTDGQITVEKCVNSSYSANKENEDTAKDSPVKLGVKRSLSETDRGSEEKLKNKKIKLIKTNSEEIKSSSLNNKVKTLLTFEKFMQNKILEKKLTRSDLEQFCIQKICEAIMHKTDVGDLHQTIKKQEQIIDNLRKDLQQLTKQTRDLDIVNKKLMNELRSQNGSKKPLVPLKITRSVGLQVKLNVNAENNTRRKPPQQTPPAPRTPGVNTNPRPRAIAPTNTGVVRQVPMSPRKPAPATPLLSQALQNRQPTPNNVTKRPQIRPKPAEPPKPAKPANSSVIDLTDEDDKAAKAKGVANVKILNKALSTTPVTKNQIILPNKNIVPNKPVNTNQNKTIAVGQVKATNIGNKVITPTRSVTTLPQGVRLTPTQVKNGSIAIPASVVTSNSGTTQLMYVVQPNSTLGQVVTTTAGGGQKAVLLNFQPANGVLTSALNGSAVSVIPTKTTNTVQLKTVPAPRKHPAPLPTPPPAAINSSLKPLLPKPHLSIRKTDTGIILQWRMPYNLDIYEGIASYQLFAYQETNAPPNTDMWRKVGDVKALALPMACTLTQFADKNKYYFAVRSVDVHKRIGAFSDPEEISL